MVAVKKIVLDVLKPHLPNSLDFASSLADRCQHSLVNLIVQAVDENTESVLLLIEGANLDYEIISGVITEMGGSVHSIDEVEVVNNGKADINE